VKETKAFFPYAEMGKCLAAKGVAGTPNSPGNRPPLQEPPPPSPRTRRFPRPLNQKPSMAVARRPPTRPRAARAGGPFWLGVSGGIP